jgi:hypothetical protein
MTLALLGVLLLVPGEVGAQTPYKVQPLIKAADPAVNLRATSIGAFEIGTLNDSGQLVFGYDDGKGDTLFLYTEGRFIPFVVGGTQAPGGAWVDNPSSSYPISMNQLGNVAFSADLTVAEETSWGTFLWDNQAKKVTPVAIAGMPAVQNRTLGGTDTIPVINNRNEIVFDAGLKNAAGEEQAGVFILGQDGKLLPVALPDQDLPGGEKVLLAHFPSLNDAGAVAFLARRQSGGREGAYLWEQGALTPVAVAGADAPGGGKFDALTAVRLNNKNRATLLTARLQGQTNTGLYLYADGKLRPVALPGQEMPGGGKFRTLNTIAPQYLWYGYPYEVSYGNDLGQYAFVAVLEGGATAAYRVEAEGTLALILKSGQTTEVGPIQRVGRGSGNLTVNKGIGLNNKGQVALTLKVAGQPDTLVLLTPTAP